MKNIRVLIADDHPVFAEGFRRILDEEEDLECVGVATDGKQAIALTGKLCPEVVVLDIAMPVLDGIQAAKEKSGGCSSPDETEEGYRLFAQTTNG